MKRLLFIIDSLNVGGAETFLMKVMRCLPREEYQFDFLVSKTGCFYESEVLECGGKIYEVPPRRTDFIGAFKKIKNVVKENEYNYVFRLGDDPIVGVDLIAAKLGGARYLVFRSCNALTGLSLKTRIMNAIMRPILNGITTTKLAPSKLAAEFTFGKRNIKNVHIINNGVDLDVFHFDKVGREKIRDEFNLQEKFVVGHIGRFNKQKNHRYLLNVFKEITKLRNDAVLMLVGKGELEGDIKKWIEELGLQNRVIFTGQRFDIPQLLSAMDIFVFPSLHEGMPNTVIEAQATGLPCIIADTITKEADITGLVKYLSLEESPAFWAKMVSEISTENRRCTKKDFKEHGYDIKLVAKELMDLICK